MGRQLASLATRGASSLPEEDENHPAHKAVQYTSEIDGHDTSVLVQPFDDRVFICVSQNGRIGTMVRVSSVTCFASSDILCLRRSPQSWKTHRVVRPL